MGVLLRKPSHAGIVVPRPEVVRPALYIEILAAVPKWVRVGAHAVFFVAESVVVVGLRLCSGSAAGSPQAATPPGGMFLWMILIGYASSAYR